MNFIWDLSRKSLKRETKQSQVISSFVISLVALQIFQTLRRGKDPALKQQACQLYLEGMGMRAIGRVLSIHHKTVSRWLVQAAQALPANSPQTKVCTFIAKKISMLALVSGGLHLWHVPRLCLWKKDDQKR